MNSHEFEIKMKKHQQEFNLLMDKIKEDVIFFTDLNPHKTTADLNTTFECLAKAGIKITKL